MLWISGNFNKKPPLVLRPAKTRGGFLLKYQKYPKNFGAFGADFRLFIVEIYTQTIVFELTSAAGENFGNCCTLFERFCSQKRWFPKAKPKSTSKFSLSPNLRIGPNKGGVFLLKGWVRDLHKVSDTDFWDFGLANRPAWLTNARNVVYSSFLMCSCTGSSLSSVWAPR